MNVKNDVMMLIIDLYHCMINKCEYIFVTLKFNIMKRIAMLVIVMLLSTMAFNAQERDRDRIQDQDRTNLVMINGEMYQLRNRAESRLQQAVRLKDGTTVNPDGTYTTADGQKLRLRNGECLDGDGVKYRNEYQYRYKVNRENQGLAQAQIQERNQNRVQYMLVDGEMYQYNNQVQERLQNQVTLADGTTVNPDGTYQTRDRQQLRLRDGECINMEGNMYQNTYQHRKMVVQKNKTAKKKMLKKKNMPAKKAKVQTKKAKKGVS